MSYVIQLEGRNETEAQKWVAQLERPPKGWIGQRGRVRSVIDPGLLEMMGGGR